MRVVAGYGEWYPFLKIIKEDSPDFDRESRFFKIEEIPDDLVRDYMETLAQFNGACEKIAVILRSRRKPSWS